jgi:hypothetical protein
MLGKKKRFCGKRQPAENEGRGRVLLILRFSQRWFRFAGSRGFRRSEISLKITVKSERLHHAAVIGHGENWITV